MLNFLRKFKSEILFLGCIIFIVNFLFIALNIYHAETKQHDSIKSVAKHLSSIVSYPLKVYDDLEVVKMSSSFVNLLPSGGISILRKSDGEEFLIYPSEVSRKVCEKTIYNEKIFYENIEIGDLRFCYESERGLHQVNLSVLSLLNCLLFFALYFFFLYLNIRTKHSIAIEQISLQVAHDIKSPLAALEIVMEDIRNLPDDSRDLILHAINRIQSIANELSNEESVKGEEVSSICLVSIALKKVINEKNIEFQENIGFEIKLVDHSNNMNFIKLNESVFCRMISNFINNSVEAVKNGDVNISVEVITNEDVVLLKIQDDGIGFPLELLEKGICRGLSIGKESGQGLGLDYAAQELAKVGGNIILSNSSVGAMVAIEIPFAKEPKWFNGSLELKNIDTVVVIDDDISIHGLWKKRLRDFEVNLFCYSKFEASNIQKQLADTKTFFLIDYDLRDIVKGTDIIMREKLIERSLLVTSNYDMEEVLSICLENNISILPKQLIPYFDIRSEDPLVKYN